MMWALPCSCCPMLPPVLGPSFQQAHILPGSQESPRWLGLVNFMPTQAWGCPASDTREYLRGACKIMVPRRPGRKATLGRQKCVGSGGQLWSAWPCSGLLLSMACFFKNRMEAQRSPSP